MGNGKTEMPRQGISPIPAYCCNGLTNKQLQINLPEMLHSFEAIIYV